MFDEYSDNLNPRWHLSCISDELRTVLKENWLRVSGQTILDVGCGLGTEVGYLSGQAVLSVGIDISSNAIRRAQKKHSNAHFIVASMLALPFREKLFGIVLDRGCFNFCKAGERTKYENEIARVSRRNARLYLRAVLLSNGEKNDIDKDLLNHLFLPRRWRLFDASEADIKSDTTTTRALIARFESL